MTISSGELKMLEIGFQNINNAWKDWTEEIIDNTLEIVDWLLTDTNTGLTFDEIIEENLRRAGLIQEEKYGLI